ncbi:MAG: alpha/beta hydrolase [Terracidiphilus sp.]
MRVLKISIVFAIILYLVFLVVFFVTQRSLLYYPSHSYTVLTEAHANEAFREISVRTQDGIDLKAWYAPATRKPFTIVFFHGNADSLRTAAQDADPYIAAGYGFLLAEYRGYSGFPGTPTETGLYNDARAYLRDLMARGIESRHLILYGHSLGTGVAVQMASEFHVGGLMLLAPYLSIPKLAQVDFPFFPSTYLALDRFDNERKIKYIHTPLLIVNGSRDQVVPASHGRRLYSLADEPKEFHSLPGRGHNDAFDEFAPLSLDWIERVCREN